MTRTPNYQQERGCQDLNPQFNSQAALMWGVCFPRSVVVKNTDPSAVALAGASLLAAVF